MNATVLRALGAIGIMLPVSALLAQSLPAQRSETPADNENAVAEAIPAPIRTALTNLGRLAPWSNTGRGAAQLTIEAKLQQRFNILDYGAVSDPSCTVDSTLAIQNAVNAAAGAKLEVPRGSFCISTVTVTANGTDIEGAPGARLLLTSTVGNGLVIGDGARITTNVNLRNFTIWTKPGLTKTGGHAIYAQRVRNLGLWSLNVGSKAELTADRGKPRLYNGLVIQGFDNVGLHGTNISGAINDCFQLSGMEAGAFGSEMTWDGGGQIVQCGHFGVHLAGGTGGVKFMSGGVSLASFGVWFSTDLDRGAINRETYLGAEFSVDSNSNKGVFADANTLGFLFCEGCWSASNGSAGFDLRAQSPGSLARFVGAHSYNNGGDGLVSLAHTKVTGGSFIENGRTAPGNGINIAGGSAVIDGSPFLARNKASRGGGYGIAVHGGHVILGSYDASANASGPLFTGVPLGRSTMGSPEAPAFHATNGAASGWSVDASEAGTPLAHGASLTIAPGSGKILLSEDRTGSTAEFLLGGGQVALVGQAGSTFVASNTPPRGKIGVFWNGVSYSVGNNSGARVTLGFAGVRVRASN